ncbi:kinase phosphorylation protein-domain-containing protein, partial [Lentinula aff. detonsa]
MFEPIRGGTRGGQAEFKWTDVSADKDRENYLGHSINAPTGRWQKNKDVHWYSRDSNDSELQRQEEIKKIKEAEADALAVALGFTPEPKSSKIESGTATTSTNTTTPATGTSTTDEVSPSGNIPVDPQRLIEKEEKRKRKEDRRARKEEKRARKEEKAKRKVRDRDYSSDYQRDRGHDYADFNRYPDDRLHRSERRKD